MVKNQNKKGTTRWVLYNNYSKKTFAFKTKKDAIWYSKSGQFGYNMVTKKKLIPHIAEMTSKNWRNVKGISRKR